MKGGILTLWHDLWEASHRLLFFLAGVSAITAPAVWLFPENIGPERIAWHSHELLFGMGGAAAGGYLLTALPAWTKQGPVSPALSKAITLLWLVARFTAWRADDLPLAIRTVGAAGYFAGLAFILAVALASARAWSRFWSVMAATALGVAAALSSADSPVIQIAGQNATPLLFVVLIILVGGRAVTAFTRRWLDRVGVQAAPRDRAWLSNAAIGLVIAAVCLGVSEYEPASGVLLLVSAALLLVRMSAWQSWKSIRYPALLMLHAAWTWTPTGLLLTGLALIDPHQIPLAAALHALTMGAMGSMIVAVMMRAAMIRDGSRLTVNPTMAGAFVLVSLSAVVRISADWLPAVPLDTISLAAACWIIGWTLFLWSFLPSMSGPIRRPVLSAVLSTAKTPAETPSPETHETRHPFHLLGIRGSRKSPQSGAAGG
ncbi:NnrS family protein [Rhizobium leguminosarum]|uniref:NnrS family protein n=1 Tax=Rhizobium leguminosarum TaxID=384 RepID=UPI00143F45D3|nr:NnrS family protein [Rhizobium leguminosarum]NKL21159.1 short-chain dehydrogenase [Rhizobium leguminosarum bv. viciae]NKL56866.1 short-chain dehydrogenase [Rhizobium leguminosarum bv. viciae]